MHIKIVGFKCHIDTTYDFNHAEMTLLKGPSGVGKSTILQAIYWCLYGNMRGIYNNAGITKKLSVTLYLNDLTIHRKKNPELLQVSKGDKTYEDKVGQEIINNRFGSRELWRACSYIEQKERCSLLSGSGSERMSLLNLLSFTGDDPKSYISRVNEELKQVNQKFLLDQQALTTEVELYKKDLEENPVTVNLAASNIQKLQEEIPLLEGEEHRLYTKLLEQEQIVGSYNYLLSQIETARKKILCLSGELEKVMTHEEYFLKKKQYEAGIDQLNNILPNLEKKEMVARQLSHNEEEIKRYTPLVDNLDTGADAEVNQEKIWNVQRKEQERRKYISECSKMGIEYNEEVIKTTITQLSEKFTYLSHLNRHIDNYKKLKVLQNHLAELDVNEPTEDKIKELEKLARDKTLLIADLKKGLELLECPKCSVPLRYQMGKLSLGDRAPTNRSEIERTEREYNIYLGKIRNMREALRIDQNMEVLTKSLEGISLDELDKYSKEAPNLSALSTLIHKLSNIQYIPEIPISSTDLQNIFNYKQLINKRTGLEGELSQCNINISKNSSEIRSEIINLKAQLSEMEDKYKHQQKVTSTTSNLQINLKNNQEQLEMIKEELDNTIKPQYDTVKILVSNKRKTLEDALWGQRCRVRGKELKEKREKLLLLHKDLTALQKLKQKAIETECKQLDDTVNNINAVLETTLPIFFPEPISLKLLLFKTLKSKKGQIKPGLNLEISYKGVKYDNVNSLSGGEGDRLSLALLLALNSVSDSPIVLLDECVSSLDANLKESCITAIKGIPDKTVICVDHEGVEGFYDRVIELS